MKAACVDRYGPPEVIVVREMPVPTIGANEVLVRQRASNVSPADLASRSGDPYLIRLFMGLTKPTQPIQGGAVAGVVERVGDAVTAFKAGDRVFGTTDPKPGAMAEFVAVAADGALAHMPERLSFEEAGGLTYSYLTAMPFLRDEAKLKPGMTILIVGAAGSIGAVAVQLAKHFGAKVTAVCSTRNIELVRSLGADVIIDRTATDFTEGSAKYDVVFDTVGKSSFGACRHLLTRGGIYLTTVPSFAILFQMLRKNRTDGTRAKMATTGLRPTPDKVKDMAVLKQLVEDGVLRGVIDRVFPLAEIAAAHRYVELGTKAGDAIVTIP